MKQYQQVKARHPDALLLFRMGDFYETFEEDAKTTARVLGITLTKRGNGAAGEVPLAGFPHHALETYLPRLVRAGYRVAICEQLEDPRKAKGLVKRDVIEIVSPGVAFTDTVLDTRKNNFVCAVTFSPADAARAACAWIDVSTGEFYVAEGERDAVRTHVTGLMPSELVVRKGDESIVGTWMGPGSEKFMSRLDDWIFHRDYAYETLVNHFRTTSLKGFGLEDMTDGLVAAGSVFHYVSESQRANIPHLRSVVPVDLSGSMSLDQATKRNLEILSTLTGDVTGSLFSVIDDTRTPMGGRMLKQWIHAPLKSVEAILERQRFVTAFTTAHELRDSVQELCDKVGDLERMLSRCSTGRSGPREVAGLRHSLDQIARIRDLHAGAPESIQDLLSRLHDAGEVRERIAKALIDDPPASAAAGGSIREGYSPELDEVRSLSRGAKDWIARLQVTERQRTGIPSLKIGFNPASSVARTRCFHRWRS